MSVNALAADLAQKRTIKFFDRHLRCAAAPSAALDLANTPPRRRILEGCQSIPRT